MKTKTHELDDKSKFIQIIRNFFPIKKSEAKILILNASILFCIIFNYTILRNLKDTLINTAPCSGPEVTCFIKSWVVLPLSVICFIVVTKLSNIFTRENIFYIANTAFLLFFFCFCYYLYPNQTAIHPNVMTISKLQIVYPSFQWVFPIYGIWSYSLFYVFAELWGTVMMSLLFWEYANEVTNTEEARRFYPFFILLANIGLMAAGSFVGTILSNQAGENLASSDGWYLALQYIILTVIAIGIISMFLYRWANHLVYDREKEKYKSKFNKNYNQEKARKLKLGFMQSLRCIFSSKYLGLIAILVISYGAAINLVELVWKKQLAIYYSDPADYCKFMSKFSVITGLTTIVTILTTKKILHHCKWITAAILTPIVLSATGLLFFITLFYKNYVLSSKQMALSTGLSLIIIWIGALQNIFSKSFKYALFDPSKEITYIPLDKELKLKGKAAVDVVGERLGKAGGGYLQQFLLILTGGSVLGITPILFVLVVCIVAGWLWAVFKLNIQYTNLLNTSSELEENFTSKPTIYSETDYNEKSNETKPGELIEDPINV